MISDNSDDVVHPIILVLLKIFNLTALVVSIFIFNNLRGSVPQLLMVFLSVTTATYLFNKRFLPLFLVNILCEYSMVLMFQYYYPYEMIMEFIWLPVILLSTAFIFPMPFNLVLTVFLGLPGYILFSYGWNSAVPFVVENDGPPYYFVFFCLPVTLLTLFLGIMNYFLFRMADRIKTLELINERINILNRETMRKVFILQNIAKGEERKRISKEVHDTAGYVFVNLIMMLQAAQAVFTKDAKKTEQLIAETRNYAERGINEIRHILRDIRDYNQVSMGIQNDIHDIAFSFQKATGVIVEINYGGWPKNLGKDLDSFFLSLTQESLTNALKHGHASTVSIQCWLENRKITMSITDNGSGAILPVQKGIGISSIEEYVREHNGEVLIQSSHGFHLVVSIPLSP